MKFKKSTGQQLLSRLQWLPFCPPMARAYLPYLCIRFSYKQAWKWHSQSPTSLQKRMWRGILLTIIHLAKIKDHLNYFIQSKVDKSFSLSLQLLQEQLIEEPMENLHASERVVRLQFVAGPFTAKLWDRLIPSLVSSGLQLGVFGIEACELPSNIPKATKVPASSIVVAINDIERAMEKLGDSLYCGEVFKKLKSSKYTYEHFFSVKKNLSLLESNDKFKNTIIKHPNKLVEILGDRECEIVS